MEGINYKEQDRQAILNYLASQNEDVEVEKVLSESGADRLRVYTLLFELELEGVIKVVRANDLGTPEIVTLV